MFSKFATAALIAAPAMGIQIACCTDAQSTDCNTCIGNAPRQTAAQMQEDATLIVDENCDPAEFYPVAEESETEQLSDNDDVESVASVAIESVNSDASDASALDILVDPTAIDSEAEMSDNDVASDVASVSGSVESDNDDLEGPTPVEAVESDNEDIESVAAPVESDNEASDVESVASADDVTPAPANADESITTPTSDQTTAPTDPTTEPVGDETIAAPEEADTETTE